MLNRIRRQPTHEIQISEPVIKNAQILPINFDMDIYDKMRNGVLLSPENVFKLLTAGEPSKLDQLDHKDVMADVYEIHERFMDFSSTFDEPLPNHREPDFLEMVAKKNADLAATQKAVTDILIEKAKSFVTLADDPSLTEEQKEHVEQLNARCIHMAKYVQQQTPKLSKMYGDILLAHSNHDEKQLEDYSSQKYDKLFTQTTVYKNTAAAKALGSGGINTVYHATIDDTQHVFKRGMTNINDITSGFGTLTKLEDILRKPEISDMDVAYSSKAFVKATLPSIKSTVSYSTLSQRGERITTEPAEVEINAIARNANTAQRDIAVSRVNTLLGLNASVQSQLALDVDGSISSAMSFAKGSSPKAMVLAPTKADLSIATRYKQEALPTTIENAKNSLKKLEDAKDIRSDQYNMTRLDLSSSLAAQSNDHIVDISNISLNRSLMNIAALDYICGHIDRHIGNYTVHVSKDSSNNDLYKCTAIDNDMSFGHSNPLAATVRDSPVVMLESNFPVIERTLADKIEQLNPTTLSNSLKGLLDEEQIDHACNRLAIFKDYLKEGNVKIVDSLSKEDVVLLQNPANKLSCLNADLFDHTMRSVAKYALPTKELRDQLSMATKISLYNNGNYRNNLHSCFGDNSNEASKFTLEETLEVFPGLNDGGKSFFISRLSNKDLSTAWNMDPAENPPISRQQLLFDLSYNNEQTKEFLQKIPMDQWKTAVEQLPNTVEENDFFNKKIANAKEVYASMEKERAQTTPKKQISFKDLVSTGAQRHEKPRVDRNYLGAHRAKAPKVKEAEEPTLG